MNKKMFAFLLCISLFVIVLACIFYAANPKGTKSLKLEAYFCNPTKNILEKEFRNITASEKKDILSESVNILYAGPKRKNLSPFPITNIKIKNIDLASDNTAKINFSREYYDLEAADELFFTSALVWTLTSLDFVDNVAIDIENSPLKKFDGCQIGLMNRTNLVINPQISDEKTDLHLVKLYFRNNKNKLSAEERVINVNPSQPIEKYIIEQIISGPINSDLMATVPADTKIRDIKTDENICYVSLSGEFANKNSDEQSQKFALYSIVNSLTELDNISKVQFLIESEKTNQAQWIFDLSKPIQRNEKIISRDLK